MGFAGTQQRNLEANDSHVQVKANNRVRVKKDEGEEQNGVGAFRTHSRYPMLKIEMANNFGYDFL